MFLLRSAFWLTLMFIIIAPHGEDAAALPKAAFGAGKNVVVGEVLKTKCQSLECNAGKIALQVLAGPNSPSASATMQMLDNPVPLPRPRPARMG